MKFDLNTLKTTGKEQKEFTFLTSVAQYIDENYGEIKPLLDSGNIQEILDEIHKKYDNFIIIKNYEELITIEHQHEYIINATHELDENKCNYETFKIYISDRIKSSGTIGYIKHTDIFFVSNATDYARYLANLKAKEKQEKINAQIKADKEENELIQKSINFAERYQIDIDNVDVEFIEAYETFISSTDKISKFKALNQFIDRKFYKGLGLNSKAYSEVSDMIESAIDNHYNDLH